ncbi:juxtaposed with another zinc finger protein 1-like isoform X2 [Limulus polyphemus]|uniref:Juxtaposed with another zinc finger protein 1-like isoform X2 n=1 Tax=Limulus polyphemus TaxID=6850 RepID=A0ABM1TGH8_LIMPO|nr:juxtaposed with another zinc finger protein 1-like isoform X2 [Limulus polyphemus]
MNVCKFNGCGLTFPTLRELIQHIEETHIDFDPHFIEKQELQPPSSLPISYILRVFTETGKKETIDGPKKKQQSQSPTSSLNSVPPIGTGSEVDDEDMMSGSEDSNDSWANQDEFLSEFILRMIGSANSSEGRPFACPVTGCKKRYKNLNGIKYHAKNGHKKEAKPKKIYKCQCGKTYMTSQGLKNHSLMHHTGLSTTSTVSPLTKERSLTAMVNSPATLALLTQGQSVQAATVITQSHVLQSINTITGASSKVKQIVQSAQHPTGQETSPAASPQKALILHQCLRNGEVHAGNEIKKDCANLVVQRKADSTTGFAMICEAIRPNHTPAISNMTESVTSSISPTETPQDQPERSITPLLQMVGETRPHTPDNSRPNSLTLNM